MKKLLFPLFLLICLSGLAEAQQQGADVNELGKFIGKTVQISGVLKSIIRPGKHHPKTVVVIDDDMLSGISVNVVMMKSHFLAAYYCSLDSSKGREVFINAKIKKVNGKLMGINYELKPEITIVIPVNSYTTNAGSQ